MLPLSFAQQRLWFLHRLAPRDTAYNCPKSLRLQGPLVVAAFAAVLREVERRHEVLRTRFPEVGGEGVQEILAPGLRVPVVDLNGLPPEAREAEARQLAAAEARRVFTLTTAAALRVHLLRLAPDDHVVCLTLHHIAGDAWSVRVLEREVAALYAAYAEGRPCPLPELEFQYVDYAAWQRRWLTGAVLEEQLAYWRQQLAGATPLALPADPHRLADADVPVAIRVARIPASVANQVRALGRQHEVTLFMTLLAAFNVLLHRWTGAEDLVVGTAIAGRDRMEFERLIGFFINMLPLRARLHDRPTFLDLLERVRECAVGAYTHQQLPFAWVVQQLGLSGREAHIPLFPVVFGLRNTQDRDFVLRDVEVRPFVQALSGPRLPLSIWMIEAENQDLIGEWAYDPAVFAPETIATLQARYTSLLERIVEHAAARVHDLDVLSEAEKRALTEAKRDLKGSSHRKFMDHLNVRAVPSSN
jgi:hypothetical protein